MTDDQYLLASVYADGVATPAERALAEADADVMAEVARIHELKSALADVEPAPDALRTAAIAAAMAAFDTATPAAAPAASQPVVARSRRASAWGRTLSLAAAAVAVLAVGTVAIVGGRRGTDDDMADRAPAEVGDTAGPLLMTEEDAAASREIEPVDDAAPAETSPADATIAELEAPAAGPNDADAYSTSGGAHDAVDTEAPATDAPSATTAVFLIENEAQLAAVGTELLAAVGDGEAHKLDTDCTPSDALATPADTASPELLAARDDLPGSAEHVALLALGDYVGPDGVVPVYVAVDLESGATYAIDATRCALVAVGTAP